MQRLLSILGAIALIYFFYALSMKNWDYHSEQKRQAIREKIKQQGLSTRFYFISARRVLLLNLFSGGIFFFYWAYKQWQAIQTGYKNISRKSLSFGPEWRSLFIFVSFYQLVAIVNRTCVYMRKAPALAPFFWGTVQWVALAATCLPMLAWGWRALAAVCFLLPSYAVQNHINLLPKQLPARRISWAELLCLFIGWTLWGLGGLAWAKHAGLL